MTESPAVGRYKFLVETYRTERVKVLSVWSLFGEQDLDVRPHPTDNRGRTLREHMMHQCLSEELWFRSILGVDLGKPALPEMRTKQAFIEKYEADSGVRLQDLATRPPGWWEEEVPFFTTRRSRAWIFVRRIAHTAHHRGQQTCLLRMLNRDLYSTYGPTADTGGLPKNGATTVYPYTDEEALVRGEREGGGKARLPGRGVRPASECGEE